MVDVSEPEGTLQMLVTFFPSWYVNKVLPLSYHRNGSAPSHLRRALSTALRAVPLYFLVRTPAALHAALSPFLVRIFSAALRAAPSLF